MDAACVAAVVVLRLLPLMVINCLALIFEETEGWELLLYGDSFPCFSFDMCRRLINLCKFSSDQDR